MNSSGHFVGVGAENRTEDLPVCSLQSGLGPRWNTQPACLYKVCDSPLTENETCGFQGPQIMGLCPLLCLLFTAADFSPQGFAQPDALNLPTTCCFIFNSKKIPLQRLKSYQITSSQCAQKAVSFRNEVAKEIHADTKEKWVQHHMNQLTA
ncbi:C-C motif chemokine 13 [Carlito syrichta]|uniref:C-C motif chemokine 13 n=1 Tax=Carlito syrichta TaxID=1868482 RepID=A0A3Q0DPD8_CARSF|nr:C-C motif chemokine 13 [Carlito syrichta]